ncbi:MAG TPA: tyrosine-type recombinase/integrase [Chitinophagales bacterium]|nr:tyrosine-type recombinase/integrase [Chitinophagales bacterium]
MIHVTFILRSATATKPTPFYMRVRFNGVTTVYPTGEYGIPKHFVSDGTKRNAYRLTGGERYLEVNHRLELMERRVTDLWHKMRNELGRIPSHAELKESFFGRTAAKDFFSFADAYAVDTETRVNTATGKTINRKAHYHYKRTLKYLREYGFVSKVRIDYDTMNQPLFDGFVSYLTTVKNLSPGMVGGHIKCLKATLTAATAAGLNSNMAFMKWRKPTSESDKIYLNKAELKALENLNLSEHAPLDRVRDLFLVGCWTGLRFSDYSNIRPEDIRDGFIRIETVKTIQPVLIPIHPVVQRILDKYGQRLPKSPVNQVMNRMLKELCGHVDALRVPVTRRYTKGGVRHTETFEKWELVETHTARRSFATNMFVDGVAVKVIRAITGHKTDASFYKYIRIDPRESAELLKAKWEAEAAGPA